MTTLTVTKARQNLGGWLKRAVSGEEIGVLVGDQVVALRPVPIMAADHMETEYGHVEESALGLRAVKSFGREDYVYERFDNQLRTVDYGKYSHAVLTDAEVARRLRRSPPLLAGRTCMAGWESASCAVAFSGRESG